MIQQPRYHQPGKELSTSHYDVAIAGGGLAGLALSIQLGRMGFKVVLFEKQRYPFHRVCGEYISFESLNFLEGLGIDVEAMGASAIKCLQLSLPNGKFLTIQLPLGGFGISRYHLDYVLMKQALHAGVTVMEETRVNDIAYDDAQDIFLINSSGRQVMARIACATFGKRSNIDISWKRSFAARVNNNLNNYVGVKYHIRSNLPVDTIALHNFPNGYCGISKVEEDKYCLCYLTRAQDLKAANGSIEKMEQALLAQNPFLKAILQNSEKLCAPVAISQISFEKKAQVERHVLMVGDAAGMITPLCGNGMSMALHGSKLAAEQIQLFFDGGISRQDMENNYVTSWKKLFSKRVWLGRVLQHMFNYPAFMSILMSIGYSFPWLIKLLIRRTHGKPF